MQTTVLVNVLTKKKKKKKKTKKNNNKKKKKKKKKHGRFVYSEIDLTVIVLAN